MVRQQPSGSEEGKGEWRNSFLGLSPQENRGIG